MPHQRSRTALAALFLAAVTLTTASVGTAASAASGALTIRDPHGDVQDLDNNDTTSLSSIDVYSATYQFVTVNKHSGLRTKISIRQLRTLAQSETNAQSFTIGFTVGSKKPVAVIQVGAKVKVLKEGANEPVTCRYGAVSFNYTSDTITVFVPNSCIGGKPARALTTSFLHSADGTRYYGIDPTMIAHL